MTLTVPAPVLSQEEATGNRFVAEKPINLSCGAVTFPDGASLIPENVDEFGFLLYREEAGGRIGIWEEEGQRWLPESANPSPQSLFYQNDRWQSILVAIGQKDRANQDKLGTDRFTGLPRYFVRCFFRGKDAQEVEHIGESPRSQVVEVLKFEEHNRAGLTMEPRSPFRATEIRLFLKDSALVAERGKIVIREEVGGFLIVLEAGETKVTLTNDGDISLKPHRNHVVRVEGDLLVDGVIDGVIKENGV